MSSKDKPKKITILTEEQVQQLETALEERIVNYFHSTTKWHPKNCYRHGENLKKLCARVIKIYIGIQKNKDS